MFESISPVLVVFFISITMSLTLSLVHKLTTNQEELKKVNVELKEINAKFKEAQKNKNQKELMLLQTKMMEINSNKMRSSMKPMMITFIIIIPVFVYLLPSLYGDLVVELDDSMNGVMKFDGIEKSLYVTEEDPILLEINGEENQISKVITIGSTDFLFKDLDKGKNVVNFKRIVVNLPFSLPIWGSNIGWLGWYILVSIPMSTVFRKALGIVQ